jgi:hypothetical protein
MRSRARRAKDVGFGVDDGRSDPRLRWYPQQWRSRYGDEFVALLDDEYGDNLPVMVRLSLVPRGLLQRARQSGLTGDSAAAADRARAGALVVLAAWTLFVIAGASFAKLSEHFDGALPHGSAAHRVPDIAFTVVQTVAGLACVLVVTGAILALPAFLRFLRSGGWGSLRGHFVRAVACTALMGVVTVPFLLWAHRLTTHQRNGGLHWYGILFLFWVTLLAITLTLWTVLAIAAARRLEFPKTVLIVESIVAAAVAAAMLIMMGTTVVWWAAMAMHAPAFLDASPGGAAGSSWDTWLIASVATMAVAVGAAVAGVVREVRVWARIREG